MLNSIGGFIEDLCFKLGLLVTTRVSTRDKRKARPQRPSRPNTNRCAPSRGKLAIGGGTPEDQVLRTAQVSKKVFSDFYNLPLTDAVSGCETGSTENTLGAAAADCLLEASVPELTTQTDMSQTVRDGGSAGSSSSIESLGAINNS